MKKEIREARAHSDARLSASQALVDAKKSCQEGSFETLTELSAGDVLSAKQRFSRCLCPTSGEGFHDDAIIDD